MTHDQIKEWDTSYRASRYLRKASPEQLDARFKAIAGNLWSTDKDGYVTPCRSQENRLQLLRLLFDVLAEQTGRVGGHIDFNERRFRDEATAAYTPPKLVPPFDGPPTCFAKFGKKEHIRRSFEEGSLKITVASGFNDPSLNQAQRDDELMHWTRTPNKELLFKLYGQNNQGEEVEMPVEKLEYFEGLSVENFYVWCCGFGYDARLFHEFKADAVLVIRDKDEFRRRLQKSVAEILPGYEMVEQTVSYYDPYTTDRDKIKPIFTKNFNFLHQNEYRFAWKSDKPPVHESIFPVLGSLQDIAEYYEKEVS